MGNFRRINNQAGFSLVETLAVVSIISIMSYVGFSGFEMVKTENNRKQALEAVRLFRDKINSAVEDPAFWQATVNHSSNINLACLRAGAAEPCSSPLTVTPVLYRPDGSVFYNSSVHGFNLDGNLCGLSLGPSLCPFKFNLETKVHCGPVLASCLDPYVVTSIKLVNLLTDFVVRVPASLGNRDVIQRSLGLASLAGPISDYLSDCSDWATQGWPSKADCEADGRWHIIYRHGNSGIAERGTLAGLIAHVEKGAQVNVRASYSGTGGEICQSVRIEGSGASKQVICLTGSRLAGLGFVHGEPGNYNMGAAEWRTTGKVKCVNKPNPTHINPSLRWQYTDACAGYATALTWAVKY